MLWTIIFSVKRFLDRGFVAVAVVIVFFCFVLFVDILECIVFSWFLKTNSLSLKHMVA